MEQMHQHTYHLLVCCQHLLNHHAVPCEGAPVQRVGPIRTEGTQAWCVVAEAVTGYTKTIVRVMERGGGEEEEKEVEGLGREWV